MRVSIGVMVASVMVLGGGTALAQTPESAGPDTESESVATVLGEPVAPVEGAGSADILLLLVFGLLSAGSIVAVRRFALLRARDGAVARYDALERAMLPATPGGPVRNIGLLLVLGSMGLWLASGMMGSIPIALATEPGGQPPATVGMTAASLGAMVAGCVVLFGASWALWPRLGGALGLPRSTGELGRDLKLGAIALGLTLPVVLLLAVVVGLVMNWLASMGVVERPDALAHETLRQLAAGEKDGAWWAVIGLVVLGVPLAEELIYRGLMQTGLRTGLGVGETRRGRGLDWIAVGMTGLIFAFVHLGTADTHSLVILFALALAMGVAYERTGRLMVPIVMHAGFNGVNILIAQVGA
ncbi:MAG: lysostaphin resistance A-like protein [Phycisphaerales bacterium]